MGPRSRLRPPAQRKGINSRSGLIKPGVIRLLLKLLVACAFSAVLILSSRLNEIPASNAQGVKTVVMREATLLCGEPGSLDKEGTTVPMLWILVQKPIVLLDDTGSDDKPVLLNEWAKRVAQPLLFPLVVADLFDGDRVLSEKVWFEQCGEHPIAHV